MKKVLIIAAILLSLGLAWWILTKKKATVVADPAPNDPSNTHIELPRLPSEACKKIPDSLTKFPTANPVLPDEVAQKFSRVPVSTLSQNFKDRILGIFYVYDLEPTLSHANYLGLDTMEHWLTTPEGKLPYQELVKGSKRCQTI